MAVTGGDQPGLLWRGWPSAALAIWLWRGLCLFPQRQNQIVAEFVPHQQLQGRKALSLGKPVGALPAINAALQISMPTLHRWLAIKGGDRCRLTRVGWSTTHTGAPLNYAMKP